ncbi:MAG: hypothetical protein ACTSV3_06645 [Candidatus Thorarchaeota archaeon]
MIFEQKGQSKSVHACRSCSCSLTGSLGNIFEAVSKFKDVVEYSEDIAVSKAAEKIGVLRQGVLVGSRYFEGTVPTTKLENAILQEMSKDD